MFASWCAVVRRFGSTGRVHTDYGRRLLRMISCIKHADVGSSGSTCVDNRDHAPQSCFSYRGPKLMHARVGSQECRQCAGESASRSPAQTASSGSRTFVVCAVLSDNAVTDVMRSAATMPAATAAAFHAAANRGAARAIPSLPHPSVRQFEPSERGAGSSRWGGHLVSLV